VFLSVAGEGECEIQQIYTPGKCAEAGLDVHAERKAQFAGN
jgi:hypothetical protein